MRWPSARRHFGVTVQLPRLVRLRGRLRLREVQASAVPAVRLVEARRTGPRTFCSLALDALGATEARWAGGLPASSSPCAPLPGRRAFGPLPGDLRRWYSSSCSVWAQVGAQRPVQHRECAAPDARAPAPPRRRPGSPTISAGFVLGRAARETAGEHVVQFGTAGGGPLRGRPPPWSPGRVSRWRRASSPVPPNAVGLATDRGLPGGQVGPGGDVALLWSSTPLGSARSRSACWARVWTAASISACSVRAPSAVFQLRPLGGQVTAALAQPGVFLAQVRDLRWTGWPARRSSGRPGHGLSWLRAC